MKPENKIMLITYADSLGKNLQELNDILTKHFIGAVGGVHILPFYPSSADRGFAPMTYEEVDPAFGDWNDVKRLRENFYIMVDFMINHISRSSEYFKDFVENNRNSKYSDFFIRYSDFWDNGEPTQEEVDLIYKRKPRAPYIDVTFKDGSTEKIWCTFDEEQVDLDLTKDATKEFVRKSLENLTNNGANIIRLDAFAYATKKAGTSCFFLEPDVWEFLKYTEDSLGSDEVILLPEIHEHYTIQKKLADKGYYVYDFALPMLLLHALYSGQNHRLLNWLEICPRNQYTTLDTHDGIGVVDVKDLMSDDEIELTKNNMFDKGANVKRIYNTTAYNNLDIYQVNCTYYSALGNNDAAYLMARAIQFFTPGIPQVYYVGLLAGENDIELLEETKVGRNINRHYYAKEEVDQNLERPVVQKLIKLMRFYNECDAFNGDFIINPTESIECISLTWKNFDAYATLTGNLKQHTFEIHYSKDGAKTLLVL